ncbi:hypothetical protein AJ79_02726 [Helicocarpus griseus UAMH5409]|uniref:glutathione-specific gamma-glutamylcyclotransferase n=1 Tax=Helicocarpus griseus UAMH5409 TaxID=1447875 RepID=A0A2B7XSV7_9EURO|nr:hypothetical protein AJ79_02726 [Helicocarpus griseus UAMH5409]
MSGDFGSGDHRGTPESPGRVVTVIEQSFWETLDDPQSNLHSSSSPSTVWGAAYHIPATHAEEVHAYLDEREIDGYTVHFTPFHPSPSPASTTTTTTTNQPAPPSPPTSPITCMVYIGLPTNAQFLRNPSDRDPANVAAVIARSRGLSGENREYLYLLERALEGPGFSGGSTSFDGGDGGEGNGEKVADGHVADLARRVRLIEGEEVSKADRRRSEVVLEHLPGPEMGRGERAVGMEEFVDVDVDVDVDEGAKGEKGEVER